MISSAPAHPGNLPGLRSRRVRFLEAYLSVFTPVPGMGRLLEHLAERRPLGLLSNTSPEHARLFIERAPEAPRFAARVYSFQVGCMKPAPATYRAIGRRMEILLAELTYADDVDTYAQGAREQGMAGIWFRGVADLVPRLARLGFGEVRGA